VPPDRVDLTPHSLVFEPRDAHRGTAAFFHGLTGTPLELTSLGVPLSGEGYRVLLPALAGHGRSPEELCQTPLPAWLDDAARVVRSLQSSSGHRILGGLSFGALMALEAASHLPDVAGIILLAPPIRLRRTSRECLLGLLSHLPHSALNLLRVRPKEPRPSTLHLLPRAAFPVHSVGAAARLITLRRRILSRLSTITAPVLIIQDPHDHLLAPDGADELVVHLEKSEVDTIWIPDGQHELTVSAAHGQVSHTVAEFLNRICLAKRSTGMS